MQHAEEWIVFNFTICAKLMQHAEGCCMEMCQLNQIAISLWISANQLFVSNADPSVWNSLSAIRSDAD